MVTATPGRGPAEIRALFETYRLTLHEWEKARTDHVTVRELAALTVEPAGLARRWLD